MSTISNLTGGLINSGWVVSTLATAIALYIISIIIPTVKIRGILTAVILAIIINFLGNFVEPAIAFFGIPSTVMSIAIFRFIFSGIVLVIAFAITGGADIPGLGSAIIVAIILSFLQTFVVRFFETL